MIVVITTARPGTDSHLAATLAGIDASATDPRRIVLVDGDPGAAVAPSLWQIQGFAKPPNTNKQNKWVTWRAFELAADAGEDLIFCEDDLAICQNGMHYMERFRVPDDVAFVSFYNPYHDINTPLGLWRSKMHVFSYNQCLKLPHRTCVELKTHANEMRENLRRGGSDDCLQEFGFRRAWMYGMHHPGIVQHVGTVSCVGTQGLEGCRVSRSYHGDQFDALTLREFTHR